MASPEPECRHRYVCAATIALCLFVAQTAAAETAGACRFEALGTASVTAILDGRSIRLADGREIRLAGIDVPPTAGGRAALENLVLGKDLALTGPSDTTDRYGRIVVFAFVNGSETPVQYPLLALGQARVAPFMQDNSHSSGCSLALLAEEQKARESRIGLWADPGYALRAAGDGPAIKPLRGRFSVAQGRVVSVRESGGTIYVNFGRRWSEALTVTILKRHERSFAAAGVEPKSLEGRIVRVRGYVDVRTGPVIEAAHPEQIEIAAR